MLTPTKNVNGSRKLAAPRGRPFARGNPGRSPGSRNKSTIATETFLGDQKDALLEKAREMALDGSVPMLTVLLKPILPRGRLINIDLPPIEYADDTVAAIAKVAEDIAKGRISPAEGADLTTVLDLGKHIELADISKRLDALEVQTAKKLGREQ